MIPKTQLKILSYLIDHPDEYLGIRELARRINTVYYLVHRNIQQLHKNNIITITQAGKTNIIQLHPQIRLTYLVAAEKWKQNIFLKKHPLLNTALQKVVKNIRSSFFIMLVFGSYAKQTARKDSDVDLLIIAPTQQHANAITKTISSVARTVSIKIHETVVTEKSFMSMLNNNELNVAQEAKKRHVILYGAENYYKYNETRRF